MKAWFRFILRHRGGVLAMLALVTALAAWSTSRATLSTSLQQLFFGESATYDAYLDKARAFGSDEFILVGYADPSPLSGASLDRLERARAGLLKLEAVGSVHSLLDAASVEGGGGMLTVETWAERARAAPDDAPALARMAAEDPRASGVFIDPTGQVGGAILVELTVNPERRGEDVPALRDGVRAAMSAAGYAERDVHLAGLPIIVAGLIDASAWNLAVLFPITGAVLLLTVWALYGRLAPALTALGVSLVAVLWTTGFAAVLDPRFSVFLAVVPAMVVIVAFSDIIHLWSAWLTERERGKQGDDAIVAAAEDVGRACLLTSATTFVGFVSLSLVPTPVFRQLGVVLGFGVSVALLLAMTLVPILQTRIAPPPIAADRGRRMQRLVGAVVAGAQRLSARRPRSVVAGFAVALSVAVFGLTQLNIDAAFLDRFAPGSRLRADSDWLQAHFVGSETLDVFVSFAETEGLLQGDRWAALTAAEADLRALEGVDQVTSVVGLLGEVHAALGGVGTPTARDAVAQELLLFESAGGEGLDRLIDFERREARLNVRLETASLRVLAERSRAAGAAVQARLPPDATVFAASMVTLLGAWLDEIIAGQRNGVLVSAGVIALMMVAGLRSLRVGLWSMLPNLLPLVVLFGGLALVWDPVDSDTLIVAMMALGIGVDDTVHFLMRYRLEAARSADTEAALARTFAFAGRAIVTTTVILGLGFLPLVAADYVPLSLVGLLLPTALVLALVADLLLVPALIQLGWMRFEPAPGAAE